MKKLINKNNKRLTFPRFDLSFEPEEVKEVENEIASVLLQNIDIKEILSESSESKEENKEEKKIKTKVEKIITNN